MGRAPTRPKRPQLMMDGMQVEVLHHSFDQILEKYNKSGIIRSNPPPKHPYLTLSLHLAASQSSRNRRNLHEATSDPGVYIHYRCAEKQFRPAASMDGPPYCYRESASIIRQ